MPLDTGRIRALLFDVDGTISDTDDLWVSKVSQRLDPLRVLLPRQDSKSFARWLMMGLETPGNMVYSLLDRFNLDAPVARLFDAMARRQKSNPKQFWIIPEMKETLQELQKKYPLAVVSARDENSTLAFLETFGLLELFTVVVTSQTCEHTKPFPQPVEWAAQKLGFLPQECLMIGDTVVDIHAGKKAGAQTVGVLCGFGVEKELLRAGADLILPVTHQLGKLLLPGG